VIGGGTSEKKIFCFSFPLEKLHYQGKKNYSKDIMLQHQDATS
jgi:hypothetical protein